MTNIFRTAIGFLILIRVWFLQKALKSKNIYLTKDSDHYIELSGDINYFFFNDNLADYWLSTFRLPGYPIVLNIFSNFLDIKYVVYINLVADLVTLFLLYKLLSMYFESNFTYIGCIVFLTNTNILISSTQIMTESLSTMLLIASYYYFKNKKYFFSGIFIALLSIFKPLGIYLVLMYVLLLIFENKNFTKQILKLIILPVIIISGIYVNNLIQYESGFYSTSSYFHLQWFNDARKSICNNYDFNDLNVSEPGYAFENWLETQGLSKTSESKILIDSLKTDANSNLFKNIHCKAISMIRSSIWNMFGIRSSNWNNFDFNNFSLIIIKGFSLIYAILMNLSVLKTFLYKNRAQMVFQVLLITLFYILITSTLPFGNSRTRVLIEPMLVLLFIDNLSKLKIKN